MKNYALLSILILSILSGCTGKEKNTSDLYNQEASLPDTLSVKPLEWKVICSFLNKNDHTMSTLYGNDIAVKSTRKGIAYPAGSVIALVSWSQKEDKHWYGALIPGTVQSIETVTLRGDAQPIYEKKEGKPLRIRVAGDPSTVKDRIAYLVSQKASVMP
jgi:hypothetical protein